MSIDVQKQEDGTCNSCSREGKVTVIEAEDWYPLHLCNKCLQWLKNRLRGF